MKDFNFYGESKERMNYKSDLLKKNQHKVGDSSFDFNQSHTSERKNKDLHQKYMKTSIIQDPSQWEALEDELFAGQNEQEDNEEDFDMEKVEKKVQIPKVTGTRGRKKKDESLKKKSVSPTKMKEKINSRAQKYKKHLSNLLQQEKKQKSIKKQNKSNGFKENTKQPQNKSKLNHAQTQTQDSHDKQKSRTLQNKTAQKLTVNDFQLMNKFLKILQDPKRQIKFQFQGKFNIHLNN